MSDNLGLVDFAIEQMNSVLNLIAWWASEVFRSLRASSPVWASERSLVRMCKRAAKPRGEGKGVLGPPCFACPNRRACLQAKFLGEFK